VRVLFLSSGYPPSRGGVQVYTYEVARQLAARAEDLIVVVPKCGGGRMGRDPAFRLVYVPRIGLVREAAMFLVTLWFALRGRADVIFNAVWLPCGAIAMLVSRLVSVPYVVAAHGSELLDRQNAGERLKDAVRRRLGWLRRRVLKSAEAVVAVSDYTRALAVLAGADPTRATAVPNGVDEKRFCMQPPSADLVAAYGLEGKRVILTVARLDYHKGHADVIQALPEVIRQVREAVYLVVGEGPRKRELEELARGLGVDGWIRFAGSVDEGRLVQMYNLADVLVMIPHETEKDVEGFGLVFLEANACGKPVVGGDSGGVGEAIVAGVTGLLVEPGDVDGIARALVTILRDGALAQRLGSSGRRRVEHDFNWASTTTKLWSVLSDCTDVEERLGDPNVRHLRYGGVQ